MNYYLYPLKDSFGIVQEGFMDEFYAGYIKPHTVGLGGLRYSVRDAGNHVIGVVTSLDEALPVIAAYYKENPPWWDLESAMVLSPTAANGAPIAE